MYMPTDDKKASSEEGICTICLSLEKWREQTEGDFVWLHKEARYSFEWLIPIFEHFKCRSGPVAASGHQLSKYWSRVMFLANSIETWKWRDQSEKASETKLYDSNFLDIIQFSTILVKCRILPLVLYSVEIFYKGLLCSVFVSRALHKIKSEVWQAVLKHTLKVPSNKRSYMHVFMCKRRHNKFFTTFFRPKRQKS